MTPQQEALLLEADKWHEPSLGTHWVGCYAEHPRCMIYMLARELRAALSHAKDCGLQLLEIAELCAKRGARIAGPNERVPDVVREVLCTALVDAERYRWMRMHSWVEHDSTNAIFFGPGANQTKPEILDKDIDEAMAYWKDAARALSAIDVARAESKD